jgi:hypothetical protein
LKAKEEPGGKYSYFSEPVAYGCSVLQTTKSVTVRGKGGEIRNIISERNRTNELRDLLPRI